MEVQEARVWLKKLRTTKARIDSYRNKIIELRTLAEHITPSYSAREGSTSFRTGSKVENCAIDILMAQEKLGELAQIYSRMIADFVDTTSCMDNAVEAMVLERRYMNGETWAKMMREMHYTYDGIMTLHKRAVKSFTKTVSENQSEQF